jgi:hypothetical protein
VKRFAPLILLVVCLFLLAAPAAYAAGTTTGIVRAHSNLDVYTWTPTETGFLEITVGWTDLDGEPIAGYPQAEVYVVVQGSDGLEPYAEMELAGLFSGWNPSSATLTLRSYQVGWPFFFSVSPSIADVRYHLTVDFRKTLVSSYTRVVDATGTAHPTHGDLFLPSTATAWHSVLHDWPGSTGDLYANWDDYVDTRSSGMLVSNGSVQWKPPVVSNASTAGKAGQWITVLPTIWNGAARPNVWFEPSYDTWPKPGSLAVDAAPAWYTWAYSDSAATTSAPAYTFGSRIEPHASGHSISFAREAGASITYAFVGDTLSWLYAAGPEGGTATLSIEPPSGSDAPTTMYTADQYASAMEYGRRVDLSGLGAGAHTVVVESDAVLYHDAFLAPTDAADPVPLAEDHSDGTTRYAWARTGFGGASDLSYSLSAAADSATAFTFSGSQVIWHYVRRPDGGIARVWIDGVNKGTVDQYGRRHKRRGAPVADSITYSGLPAGTHTILIVNTGEKSSVSYGTVVTSDAFAVGGVTFED